MVVGEKVIENRFGNKQTLYRCPFKRQARISDSTGKRENSFDDYCVDGKGPHCEICKHYSATKISMEKREKHKDMLLKARLEDKDRRWRKSKNNPTTHIDNTKSLTQMWSENKRGISKSFELAQNFSLPWLLNAKSCARRIGV